MAMMALRFGLVSRMMLQKKKKLLSVKLSLVYVLSLQKHVLTITHLRGKLVYNAIS